MSGEPLIVERGEPLIVERGERLTPEQRRAIRRRMRVPIFAFVVLLAGLAAIVTIGALGASHAGSIAEFVIMVGMVLTVLLFSMEVTEETPLLRFFAALGFAWVGALFTMTLVDYLTR